MSESTDRWSWVLGVVGAIALANGLWGMFGSVSWYEWIAKDTGPLNVHMVRDIGEAFSTVGLALIWAARTPRWRVPLTGVAALFLGMHALGHVYEISVGELGADHWVEDIPGVFLPGAFFAWLTFHFSRSPHGET